MKINIYGIKTDNNIKKRNSFESQLFPPDKICKKILKSINPIDTYMEWCRKEKVNDDFHQETYKQHIRRLKKWRRKLIKQGYITGIAVFDEKKMYREI